MYATDELAQTRGRAQTSCADGLNNEASLENVDLLHASRSANAAGVQVSATRSGPPPNAPSIPPAS